ncbi:unnamed protein product [Mortierella alpina]
MEQKTVFTDKQVEEFQECFNTFDRNADGSINRRELHALLHTVGHKVNPEGFEVLLKEFDVDTSGTIDFQEFILLVDRLMKHKLQNQS